MNLKFDSLIVIINELMQARFQRISLFFRYFCNCYSSLRLVVSLIRRTARITTSNCWIIFCWLGVINTNIFQAVNNSVGTSYFLCDKTMLVNSRFHTLNVVELSVIPQATFPLNCIKRIFVLSAISYREGEFIIRTNFLISLKRIVDIVVVYTITMFVVFRYNVYIFLPIFHDNLQKGKSKLISPEKLST